MKKIISFLLVFFCFISNNLSASEKYSDLENKIFKNLRCLICQGQSVADSNSEFAQTLKLVVKDKIREGKSEKEIYEFLIDKYGEWIVYKPPFNKVNSLLWILPYFALLIGGLIIMALVKKRSNR